MRCRTGSHRRPLRRCRSAMEFGPWRCDVRGGRARRRSSNMRCRVRRHGRSLRRLRWMKGRCGGTRHRRRRCRTRHRRRCCWMRRRSRPPGQPWRTASSMLLGERTHACSKHGNTNQKRCTMNTARKHDHELPVGSGRPPKSTRGRKNRSPGCDHRRLRLCDAGEPKGQPRYRQLVDPTRIVGCTAPIGTHWIRVAVTTNPASASHRSAPAPSRPDLA